MLGLSRAAGAAVDVFDATVRGGWPTLRMPAALIDEGPQRRVHRYLPLGRGGRRAAALPVLLVPPLAAPAICFDLRRGAGRARLRLETAPGGHLGVLTGRAARGTTWVLLDRFLAEHEAQPRLRRGPAARLR